MSFQPCVSELHHFVVSIGVSFHIQKTLQRKLRRPEITLNLLMQAEKLCWNHTFDFWNFGCSSNV